MREQALRPEPAPDVPVHEVRAAVLVLRRGSEACLASASSETEPGER